MTTKTLDEQKKHIAEQMSAAAKTSQAKGASKFPSSKFKTPIPGPKAKAAIEKDKHWISGSYTRSYPLVARRGRGVMVEDVDGNEFMDFAAGIAVCSTGHCHPHVVQAIQKQAGELIHMSGTDFYYESMAQLAERLSKSAPMKGPHKVYYGNSGTEAIEAALKLARYHTRRPYVIAFYNSFHGRTMGALSLTASKVQQRRGYAPVSPAVTHVPYPHTFRRPEGTDAKQYAIDCARFIEEKVLKTTLPPEEVAAIFVEPVQGEGGYVPAPTEFLQELRAICDRHGILLVADEVQSGCGRTGKMWAIQHSGVEPDILCSAKGIASGMPLGVMMAKANIMDWKPGSHASTFGGNPVCIASALATLDVLEGVGEYSGQSAIDNAAKIGTYMLERMSGWVKKYEIVGEVRGRGLMIGVEIVKDKKSKALAGKERDRIVDELCFERGVLLLGCGETTVRISPPLIITKEDADVAMDVLEEAIATVDTECVPGAGPGKMMGA